MTYWTERNDQYNRHWLQTGKMVRFHINAFEVDLNELVMINEHFKYSILIDANACNNRRHDESTRSILIALEIKYDFHAQHTH